jgi:hypothetical protein
MSLPRAFLVLGAESSGTRLLTRILMACGCKGDHGHRQRFDNRPISGDPIVWRRSVPHERQWLDLSGLVARLRDYEITPVVIVRDFAAVTASQVACGHVSSLEQARAHVGRAYSEIFTQLARHDLVPVVTTFETYILHPLEAQREIASRLGLAARLGVAA